MAEGQTKSELTEFPKVVAKMMTLQKHLDDKYHTEQFLRDLLMTANDIPHFQSTLLDRRTWTRQQTVNHIRNQISDKPQTSGSKSACVIDGDIGQVEEAHHCLGKSFGGDARRPTKPPWKSKAPYPRNCKNNT